VRLTAQRILARHLRDGRTENTRSTDPPSERFWPGIYLDLDGAVLIDFDLEDAVMAGADFGRATFSGATVFNQANFIGHAGFNGATFTADAWFDGATLSNAARFEGATPTGWRLGPDGSGGYTVVHAADDAAQPVPGDGSDGASRKGS